MAVSIAIDFETSGYASHFACAVGMAKLEDCEIVDTYYRLIRPPSSRVYFTNIHGLRWADLKDAPTFAELWDEMLGFIGEADFFIAHNAPFDRKILRGCCEAFCGPAPAQAFLCTLKGSRKILPLKSRSLDSVCSYFGIELEHHHALSDAAACAQIYKRLIGMGLANADMVLK